MMINRQPIIYTGEGFRGERLLATTAVLLTIVSTVLLIKLTIKQHQQTDLALKELKRKNVID
jgi:hypothetical protein